MLNTIIGVAAVNPDLQVVSPHPSYDVRRWHAAWPAVTFRAEKHSYPLASINVQFSSVQSLQQFLEKKSVKGQPEKMSLEPCSKLTATDGRGAKLKWQ